MDERIELAVSIARKIHHSYCKESVRCEYGVDDYRQAEQIVDDLENGNFTVQYGTLWYGHDFVIDHTRFNSLQKEKMYPNAKAVMRIVPRWVQVNE